MEQQTTNNISRRGFASMDPERRRQIASKGGRIAHSRGTAHKFTSTEAKEAGRKGGQVVSQDRAHMSMIGREGVKARRAKSQRLRESGIPTSGVTPAPAPTATPAQPAVAPQPLH